MTNPEKKYAFETLQLHAGQEEPDSATGGVLYQFIRQLLLSLRMLNKLLGDLL